MHCLHFNVHRSGRSSCISAPSFRNLDICLGPHHLQGPQTIHRTLIEDENKAVCRWLLISLEVTYQFCPPSIGQDFIHMATANCKEGWEMQCSCVPQRKRDTVWGNVSEDLCGDWKWLNKVKPEEGEKKKKKHLSEGKRHKASSL